MRGGGAGRELSVTLMCKCLIYYACIRDKLWRKDLKVGGARRRGRGDPKHQRLMCASPGSSEESLVTHWRSPHSQAGSFGLKG